MIVRRVIRQELEIQGLGQRIKAARQSDPRSLTALSKAVGVSRSYWYALEKDSVPDGLAEGTLRKIEAVLGVDFGITFPQL